MSDDNKPKYNCIDCGIELYVYGLCMECMEDRKSQAYENEKEKRQRLRKYYEKNIKHLDASNKKEKINNHEKILWELQKYAYEIDDSLIDAFLKEIKNIHEIYIKPIKRKKS